MFPASAAQSVPRRSAGSRLVAATVLVVFALLALVGCSGGSDEADLTGDQEALELEDPPRRYAATWTIDTASINRTDVGSPIVYREVVDDQIGTYLVESPDHLAFQRPDDVLFCAAMARLPFDPFCAEMPRAEGAPYVLSYPVQLLREWSPSQLYDLASYREISLVAASDPDSWLVQTTNTPNGIAIECFLVVGETSAADTGFELCFTDDDLHLVASVDLQRDLIFEVDLVSYERVSIADEFDINLDDFIEKRPMLQEQLLELYPEIPAARPTPVPTVDTGE